MRGELGGLRGELAGVRGELATTRQQFEAALDNLSLRLTVRLGGMVAIAVAILATIIKR
jgi:hypothetical protein